MDRIVGKLICASINKHLIGIVCSGNEETFRTVVSHYRIATHHTLKVEFSRSFLQVFST
jgi:hypothetical protein